MISIRFGVFSVSFPAAIRLHALERGRGGAFTLSL